MHKFCACSRSAQDGDQHPQDRHPPSPRRSTPIPRIVTHHPWNGHPTSLGRSATILRTVSHHLHDDHLPAPRMVTFLGKSPTILRKLTQRVQWSDLSFEKIHKTNDNKMKVHINFQPTDPLLEWSIKYLYWSEFSCNLDRVPLKNNVVGVENSLGFQFSWDL